MRACLKNAEKENNNVIWEKRHKSQRLCRLQCASVCGDRLWRSVKQSDKLTEERAERAERRKMQPWNHGNTCWRAGVTQSSNGCELYFSSNYLLGLRLGRVIWTREIRKERWQPSSQKNRLINFGPDSLPTPPAPKPRGCGFSSVRDPNNTCSKEKSLKQ